MTPIDPGVPVVQLWTMVAAILTTLVGLFLRNYPQVPDLYKRLVVAAIAVGMTLIGLYYEAGQVWNLDDIGRTWMVVFLGAAGLYSVLVKPLADNVQGVKAISVKKSNNSVVVDPGK